MRDSYDVVIIGSGFGGAVTACRLAESGRSVAVLERGRRWHRSEFPRAIAEVAGRAFWEPGRSHGFIEYSSYRKVDVIQGAGVGGGSLHYFNVNLRAAPEIFADARWPRRITRDLMDPYYERALEMLESANLRPPPGRDALPARTVAFTRAATRAGLDVEPVPIAVYTSEPRLDPLTGEDRNPCNYSGDCLFGCDIGAKNTLDTNYLARAERLHGAEILPLHSVDFIRPDGKGGYEIRYQQLGEDPKEPAIPGTVRAPQVVVAAGTVGSTRLLLRCRDRGGGLPNLPQALGNRLSLNGEMLLAFARDTTEITNPGLGPPITVRATARTPDHLITIEDLGVPDSLLWYLEGGLDLRLRRISGLGSFLLAYAGSLVGPRRPGGADVRLDRLVSESLTSRTIPYLGMANDSSDGRIRLSGDSIEIDWNVRRNLKLYRDMYKVMARIAEAAGARLVPSVLYRWPLRKILTAHPLGGCSMGDDPTSSVVDHRNQVWGHPGLYVVDGSVMPTALAVNPSLTIAAIAERAAHWMVNGTEAGATVGSGESKGGI
jgi:cholesterol oxidase